MPTGFSDGPKVLHEAITPSGKRASRPWKLYVRMRIVGSYASEDAANRAKAKWGDL